MRDHSRQFFIAQLAYDASGHRDRGAFRAAPGGEGVRLILVDDIKPRHRQPRIACQPADHSMEVRRRFRTDLARIMRNQRQAVRIPECVCIGAEGDHQSDQRARRPADQPADRQKQRGHRRQQHRGLEIVHASSVTPVVILALVTI